MNKAELSYTLTMILAVLMVVALVQNFLQAFSDLELLGITLSLFNMGLASVVMHNQHLQREKLEENLKTYLLKVLDLEG